MRRNDLPQIYPSSETNTEEQPEPEVVCLNRHPLQVEHE